MYTACSLYAPLQGSSELLNMGSTGEGFWSRLSFVEPRLRNSGNEPRYFGQVEFAEARFGPRARPLSPRFAGFGFCHDTAVSRTDRREPCLAGGLSLRKQALLPNQALGFGVSRGGPAPRVLGKSSLRHGIGILLFGLRHVTVVF